MNESPMKKKPSLLSPAGDPEKLRAALHFGADAVYCAGRSFGMRAAAGNFSREELAEAVSFVHAEKKEIHVAVNTMPRGGEYAELEKYLSFLDEIRPDALIVSDLGVIETAKRFAPHLKLHLSTQASVVSSRAAAAYHALGVSRIVLARELSLEEIVSIRKEAPPSLELEVFIHGAMCVSYSGRCLLSNYLASRDGNRGFCAQPCRWEYRLAYIEEEKRPGEFIPVEEDRFGSYVMSSRDLCMIDHIPSLCESGIDCFKIEGRMKSAYYTAAVTNAYRMAIDAYLSDKEVYEPDPRWKRELESVSHREYATGYFFTSPEENARVSSLPGPLCESAFIAPAVSDSDGDGFALFVQKNKTSVGEELEILTPGKTGAPFVVTELTDENGTPIDSTPRPLTRFRMKVPFPVRRGDIARRSPPSIEK